MFHKFFTKNSVTNSWHTINNWVSCGNKVWIRELITRDYFNSIRDKERPPDKLSRLKRNLKWTRGIPRFLIIDMLAISHAKNSQYSQRLLKYSGPNKDTALKIKINGFRPFTRKTQKINIIRTTSAWTKRARSFSLVPSWWLMRPEQMENTILPNPYCLRPKI